MMFAGFVGVCYAYFRDPGLFVHQYDIRLRDVGNALLVRPRHFGYPPASSC
jgi:hypothetical protein